MPAPQDRAAVSPTAKEFDLPVASTERAGTVVPRAELLSAVFGHQQDADTRTVDLHVSELRAKLERIAVRRPGSVGGT